MLVGAGKVQYAVVVVVVVVEVSAEVISVSDNARERVVVGAEVGKGVDLSRKRRSGAEECMKWEEWVERTGICLV